MSVGRIFGSLLGGWGRQHGAIRIWTANPANDMLGLCVFASGRVGRPKDGLSRDPLLSRFPTLAVLKGGFRGKSFKPWNQKLGEHIFCLSRAVRLQMGGSLPVVGAGQNLTSGKLLCATATGKSMASPRFDLPGVGFQDLVKDSSDPAGQA